MSAVEVVLIGGSALHREGLRQSLDPSQFAVIAEGHSLGTVLDLMVLGIKPGLVIADVSQLCDEDFEDLRRIRDRASACRFAVLSNGLDLADLARVFKVGANGCLVSDSSREAFSRSLLVMMGEEEMVPGLLANVLTSDRERSDIQPSKDPADLSDRDHQILRCRLDAHSNKQIARTQAVSPEPRNRRRS